MIRYPRPLVDGDLVAVTAPSAGVGPAFLPRLEVALATVRSAGFTTRVGPLTTTPGIASGPAGGTVEQRSPGRYRAQGYDDWESHPEVEALTLDTAGTWARLDADGPVEVTGRLVGGCLETVTHLAGTPFGDVPAFAAAHAPEGLVLYLECAESNAADTTRRLLGLRYAGWFDAANAVLVGRTRGADLPGWTQHDAVRHAIGDLGVPVLADVECGHVPPHLALVNGALATVRHDAEGSTVRQVLR